ncbi:acyl-CoA dehydrogenase family protein [Streptomyces sp. NPDC004539]|uniref:acyl-CoA dehydrogenase family protein n=1 Tax=Streptomyces sp. NPDC004539 TaxID=3154280 RepID=UPI0033B22830
MNGYGLGLFLGEADPRLLALPEGDPRRLPAEEEAFLARLREFCEKEADSAGIERDDRIPDEVIEGLKDLGAMSIRLPARYGGLGLSARCYHRALMLTSTTHPALSELLAAHQAIGLAQPVALFGTPEQKEAFLPRCVREISAFALTEADVGNDPFRVRTTAVRDPGSGGYVLDGVKMWTTNAVVADLLVVLAAVPAGEGGGGGLTAFVVEADAPGVTVEHRGSFLGLRGLENGCVRLHRVAVPVGHRIGAEGEGLTVALAAQDTGRLSLPAASAATAKWSLAVARQWCAARVQWGRPIGRHDAVAGKLASIAATAFALEALVEVVARQAERPGLDTRADAELAKLFATERAWRVADDLVQIRGGRGYETAASAARRGERGVPVEQQLRDVRIGRIFDGSSEALRSFLAQELIAAYRSAARRPAPGELSADGGRGGAEAGGGVGGGHRVFVAETSRRLAEELGKCAARPDGELDVERRGPGRIVDIGAELYAMSASLAYAEALEAAGVRAGPLADAFCAQSRLRIGHLFARLAENSDAGDRALAGGVLEGAHGWLEDGVVDPSTDGPWIAVPEPGPARTASLRRVVGRAR